MAKVNCSFPWQNGLLNNPSSLPLVNYELEVENPRIWVKVKAWKRTQEESAIAEMPFRTLEDQLICSMLVKLAL